MNEKVILLAKLYGKLPQYKCHKVVSAGKITRLYEAHGMLRVECEALEMPVVIPLDFLQRHAPEVGGYLVMYRDGYLSYSPAEAFEGGYSAFNPEAERMLADNNRRAAMAIEAITANSEAQQAGTDENIDLEAADFSDALMWLKEGKRVARAGWNGAGQFAWMVPDGVYPARMEAIKGYFPDDQVPYGAYFALKNAQATVVPWVPSVGDLLATDWQVVKA